jgi:hypothetical protein
MFWKNGKKIREKKEEADSIEGDSSLIDFRPHARD